MYKKEYFLEKWFIHDEERNIFYISIPNIVFLFSLNKISIKTIMKRKGAKMYTPSEIGITLPIKIPNFITLDDLEQYILKMSLEDYLSTHDIKT